MAQLVISWKIYTLAFILLAILFFIAPYIMEDPRARNMPLPLLIVWWCEVILQGIAVLALISTVLALDSLVWDALGWLIGILTPTPTPARLEDGPHVEDLAVPVPTAPLAATELGATPSPRITAACKVGTIILNVSVILPTILKFEVVLLHKSLPENVIAAALFVLNGLEVLLVPFLVRVFDVWLLKNRRAQDALVEVVFDEGTTTVAEEVPDLAHERAKVKANKASPDERSPLLPSDV